MHKLINHKDVLAFIKRVTNVGPEYTIMSLASSGFCYWFAKMQVEVFKRDDTDAFLMYDPVDNHFAAYIDTDLSDGTITSSMFDVRGHVTYDPRHNWMSWIKYRRWEPFDALRVIHNTIMFEDDWEEDQEMTEDEAQKKIWEYNKFIP